MRISYGEEGDYFLSFTLSAKTESGFKKAVPAYEEMIKGYHRNP